MDPSSCFGMHFGYKFGGLILSSQEVYLDLFFLGIVTTIQRLLDVINPQTSYMRLPRNLERQRARFWLSLPVGPALALSGAGQGTCLQPQLPWVTYRGFVALEDIVAPQSVEVPQGRTFFFHVEGWRVFPIRMSFSGWLDQKVCWWFVLDTYWDVHCT